MILLTGANGLIGSHLLRTLIDSGEQVRAIVREDSDLSLINDLDGKYDKFIGDITSILQISEAFHDVKQVIHSAALVSFHAKDIEKMKKINVSGTTNLVNLSLENDIEHFIYISSVAALGKSKQTGIVSESDKRNSKLYSFYGKSKHEAELEVWRGYSEGLPSVIVNPSTTLGPGDWNRSSTQLFKYVWNKNKYYSQGYLNFVDIRDLTEAIIELKNKKIKGENLIVSAGAITYKEFFEKVANCFQIEAPRSRVTKFKSRVAVITAYLLSLFTGSKPFITKEIARNSFSRVKYSNEKILNLLNMNFRTLDETIIWTCEILQKKYSAR